MGESRIKLAALFAGMALSVHAFGEGIESTAGSEQAFISFDQMGWKGSIGAGAGIVPSYEGAGTHRTHLIPLLDAEAGRFFFGTRLDFEEGYESKPTNEDRKRAGAKLSWADPRYMQTFFGVNSSQSASSGLPQYNAESGIKDYGINVNWRHNYSRKWFSNTGFQARRLSGGISGSPLVATRLETSASFLMGYRF